MNWLKRNEPIVLSQSSSIPYVILESGVYLCFDNLYTEQTDKTNHHIGFKAYKNDYIKQSTNHFRLKKFPAIIPFDEIQILDDSIASGRIIKQAHTIDSESKNILISSSAQLIKSDDKKYQEFVEMLDQYDNTFILTGEEIDPQIRILEDVTKIIHHRGWYPTLVTIADALCPLKSRKYCWTKSVPSLTIHLHEMDDFKDMKEISDCLDNIGIIEKEIIWG